MFKVPKGLHFETYHRLATVAMEEFFFKIKYVRVGLQHLNTT